MIRTRLVFSLISLLLFSLSTFSVAAEKQKVVVYGDNGYPPYSYLENDIPKGVYVDILQTAFSRMANYDVTIELKPWKRGVNFVKTGKVMALFPPYFSDERTPWMLFSEPILQEQVVVFGKADKLAGKTQWPEDFYNSKVGLNSGFSPASMGGEKFTKAIAAGKISVEEAENNEMNLKKLNAGRIDFYINDKLIDTSEFSSIERGIVAKNNDGYLGFTKKNEAYPYIADFVSEFNSIIKQMKEAKEIDSILGKYIK